MAKRPSSSNADRRAQAIASVHKAFDELGEWWKYIEINVRNISTGGQDEAYSLSTTDPDLDPDDEDED